VAQHHYSFNRHISVDLWKSVQHHKAQSFSGWLPAAMSGMLEEGVAGEGYLLALMYFWTAQT